MHVFGPRTSAHVIWHMYILYGFPVDKTDIHIYIYISSGISIEQPSVGVPFTRPITSTIQQRTFNYMFLCDYKTLRHSSKAQQVYESHMYYSNICSEQSLKKRVSNVCFIVLGVGE